MFCKEELESIFGKEVLVKNYNSFVNVSNQLKKSKIKSPVFLYKLFKQSSPDNLSISKFTYWLSDYPFSLIDLFVYNSYLQVVKGIKVSPNPFYLYGSELLCYLKEWRGKAGNTDDQLLEDYFKATTSEANSFNKSLIYKPKAILGSYGRGVWENHIKEVYGSKEFYLIPSAESIKKNEKERLLLFEIQKYRTDLLLNKKTSLYDKLGEMLLTKGIQGAYYEIFKRKPVQ